MTALWIIVGAVVLFALVSVTHILRRFLFAFVVAAGGLLLLHFQANPAEAGAALAAMGGGVALASPLRRIVTGGWL
ncbi:MAG: hypothetical protein RI538_03780 [Salibaculum sp.]|jgi:hypothetical protein|uniref:hypothetical protein n=1 Tax=Roseovarius halophilus (ex Wu et al. 2025) TaxID=3376060 RepID=UPI00286FF687|nr:hypothetical protein [Salibaculum sp.]MDR9428531.1 hypothetical protein [Salibaculum sp.]MDR9481888.1 hypothetical protein [Salibaculum sp.]